jgi:phosphomannomutase/phosphoglucomutase
MKLNEHIFRANDIRGIAYEDLNQEVVINLGKALGSEARDRGLREFIIGRDGDCLVPIYLNGFLLGLYLADVMSLISESLPAPCSIIQHFH